MHSEMPCEKERGKPDLSVLDTRAKPAMFKTLGSHLGLLDHSSIKTIPLQETTNSLVPKPWQKDSPKGAAMPLLWILARLATDSNLGRDGW